ncbi:CGNR zinc finger domain-containing protein [Azospirillum canadense]|uniref:CGNR zinc finger domain-containing protein n=1 Tax=Azospirillum canadense TaxID=403962 RepID=UPI0022272D04|nr:CGNR zinc finger domain-containing protein [Azospirillum canadense]MCW2242071.1 putative RNA-binding Zn ribbon-like protein [Azospirillum canadense]
MSVNVGHYPDPILVGDHLAMDFLNSIENPRDASTDCLRDGHGFVLWLLKAGAIDAEDAARLQGMPADDLDAVAGQARRLRDWFRQIVLTLAAQAHPHVHESDLGPLNDVLAKDNSFARITGQSGDGAHGLQLRRVNRWASAEQTLQPIASSIARLLTEEDLGLVRNCEGPTCTLLFLDRTKAHKRRWCSMAVCGNRAKAAAHRARAKAV